MAMKNPVEQHKLANSLSPDQLEKELKQPSGMIPGYMLAAVKEERSRMEQSEQNSPPEETLYEQLVRMNAPNAPQQTAMQGGMNMQPNGMNMPQQFNSGGYVQRFKDGDYVYRGRDKSRPADSVRYRGPRFPDPAQKARWDEYLRNAKAIHDERVSGIKNALGGALDSAKYLTGYDATKEQVGSLVDYIKNHSEEPSEGEEPSSKHKESIADLNNILGISSALAGGPAAAGISLAGSNYGELLGDSIPEDSYGDISKSIDSVLSAGASTAGGLAPGAISLGANEAARAYTKSFLDSTAGFPFGMGQDLERLRPGEFEDISTDARLRYGRDVGGRLHGGVLDPYPQGIKDPGEDTTEEVDLGHIFNMPNDPGLDILLGGSERTEKDRRAALGRSIIAGGLRMMGTPGNLGAGLAAAGGAGFKQYNLEQEAFADADKTDMLRNIEQAKLNMGKYGTDVRAESERYRNEVQREYYRGQLANDANEIARKTAAGADMDKLKASVVPKLVKMMVESDKENYAAAGLDAENIRLKYLPDALNLFDKMYRESLGGDTLDLTDIMTDEDLEG